jgi:hypothetical protein
MKNIHVLPTDKPSRLHLKSDGFYLTKEENSFIPYSYPKNIYITSDEEIKKYDWYIADNKLYRASVDHNPELYTYGCKKLILTTDQDLIKDGVQAIDDEFLEWFVKNPSCEEVEVSYGLLKPFKSTEKGYMIHLPDNGGVVEPKQKFPKPNIIDNWLEKNGDPEIDKQVEQEYKELCEQETFEEVVNPLIKWLSENTNPHTTVIVRNNFAELLEGIKAIETNEFLTD